MSVKAEIRVTLGIQGPILCKATAPSAWGIDATFDRDFRGNPYIDRSHLKGKLREALVDLGKGADFIDKWLGSADSRPGMLILSDFYCADGPAGDTFENRITRTRMDRVRGVVDETALVCLENAFPLRADPYLWTGNIVFTALDRDEAEDIYGWVSMALKWVTAVGAEKTAGFGKLVSVKTSLSCEDVRTPVLSSSSGRPDEWFTLTVRAFDPLVIGGVKRKANYLETETIITGSIIKGALAATLNSLCGVDNPIATPINSANSRVARMFPVLSEHFSRIRFTHAFPTGNDRRPVVIPFSAVSAGGVCYDVATSDGPQLVNGIAPVFQIDWKAEDYPVEFGWAVPRTIAKTRTAVDSTLRRAEDSMMFTYQYVCPVDSDDNEILWRGLVHIPEEVNSSTLQAEVLEAVTRIEYLGKRRSRVEVSIEPGKGLHAQEEGNVPAADGTVIVLLQSDTLMINPDEFRNDQTANNLRMLYERFWMEASDESMSLKRFFAHQRLLGGYLVRRSGGRYYPFYLTGAGSVFVLESTDVRKSADVVDIWRRRGLPVPAWVEEKYGGREGLPLWNVCPFIPENGYAEVMVNLKWHFDKSIDTAGGAE
ncbi:MAG: hypothetical protein GXP46_12320 [Deferribacteres bacterium]|nr:hypothetical protein [Deferribacteres bacterium]